MTPLSGFRRFALRDLAVVALTFGVGLFDATLRSRAVGGPGAAAVGVAAGVLAALSGFLCHEWGHLLGAVAARGTALPPRNLHSPFLFFFDVARSDRRSFLWMSYGGYLASAVAVPAVVVALPWSGLSGKVAGVLAGLGMLVTLALEIPTTVRVARGGALPRGGVFADEKGHPSASEPTVR